MNKIKLIAFDLDGTLLSDGCIISEYSRNKINEFHKLGINIAVLSGRGTKGIECFLDGLPVTYISSQNGAIVKNIQTNKNEVVYQINTDLVKKFISFFENEDVTIIAFTEENSYISRFSENRYSRMYQEALKPKFLKDFDGKETVTSIDISVNNMNDIDRIQTYITKEYGLNISITHSGNGYLQINKKGITKGSALEYISTQYGISSQNVVAIGDCANDKPMLDFAEFGVAMINGEDSLKISTQYISEYDNNNDGAVKFVEKLLKKE